MNETRVVPAAVIAFLLACGAAAAPAHAADTVDLQVLPQDRVRGTLRPADERESFYVAGLRGTRFRAVAKRVGDGSPKPTLTLLDDAGLTTLKKGARKSYGAEMKTYVLPATGGVRFRVAGDGSLDGDYKLELTATARTRWTRRSTAALGPGAEATFSFAAPRDAKATITVRREGRKALEPLLVDVTGPHGEVLASDLAASSRSADVLVVASIPSAGEWTVRFRNDGAVAGSWTATVRLARTKYVRKTVDLRDTALAGAFAGAQSVVGRIAEPDAETVIAGSAGLDLDGVAITIPSGAVSLPTLVTITRTEEFFVDDDTNAAGVAVEFAPSGTQFAKAASVTLPYDASSFDDAATELSIVVEDPATGERETIAATSVDTAASTATFPALHFSRFQPVSRQPRPFRGRFVDLVFRGRAGVQYGGALALSVDRFESLTGPRTPRPLVRRLDGQEIAWQRTVDEDDATFGAVVSEGIEPGLAGVVSNTNVRLVSQSDDVTVRRGRDPRLHIDLSADGAAVSAHFVLERPSGDPTAGNLLGGWHGRVVEFAGTRAVPAGVHLTLATRQFELDVAADGAATASAAALTTWRQTFPFTAWTRTTSTKAPKQGTLVPDGEAARLSMRIGQDAVLGAVDLVPVLGGDALIGLARRRAGLPGDPATAAVTRLVVLVRRDTDGAAADLAGQFVTAVLAMVLEDHAGAPSTLGFEGSIAVRSHDDLRIGLGLRTTVTHDAMGLPTVSASPLNGTFTFTVAADGAYKVTGGLAGGFVAAGRPNLFLAAGAPARLSFGMGTLVKPADLGP